MSDRWCQFICDALMCVVAAIAAALIILAIRERYSSGRVTIQIERSSGRVLSIKNTMGLIITNLTFDVVK